MNSKLKDKIWTYAMYAISFLVLLLLLILIGYVLVKGIGVLNKDFIFGNPKIGEVGGGIAPQLFNSFYMLFISLMITVPLGIGAGIYLCEYAKEGIFLNIIRISIETMSSLPSIVVGLFGFLAFVKATNWGFTLLSGALALSILNLPILTRISENAIREASKNVKNVSLALGATRFQTIKKVILPSASLEILTGIILAAGRILGEAATLLYTAGMSAPPLKFTANITSKFSPFSLMRPAETLSVYIWQINSESTVKDAARIADGSAAMLIIMVILFNILARVIGKKIYRIYTGTN